MNVLAIYGASGLGREVLGLANLVNRNKKKWDIIRFVDDDESLSEIAGLEVQTLDFFLEKHAKEKLQFVIALGEPRFRNLIYNKLQQKGQELITLIHPSAEVGERATIEQGCVIQYGCFVSCDVHIRANTYMQPNSSVGHDSSVGEHTVISSYVCVAGHSSIGDGVYIGMNTPVMEGLSIGNNTIVGMGSVVARSIPEGVIALGNPARPMKKNDDQRVFNRK